VRITQGGVSNVLARQVTLEQSVARTVVAQEVRIDRPSGILVLLAARVQGDVRPVIDWRGALAFGAVAAVLVSLFRRAR
jgi:hypothetical protein